MLIRKQRVHITVNIGVLRSQLEHAHSAAIPNPAMY